MTKTSEKKAKAPKDLKISSNSKAVKKALKESTAKKNVRES